MMANDNGRSSFGFEENIVAALSYFLLGPIIYIMEQRSNFVRFHALQSTIGYVILLIFWVLVRFIGALSFLRWAPGILALIFVCVMILKAYDGEEYKIPIIGRIAFQTVYEKNDDIIAESKDDDEDSK